MLKMTELATIVS